MRRIVLAVLIACTSAASGRGASTQRFRSGAELVQVDVLVTDRRQVVTGLTAQDFEVLDNGVPQNVQQLYIEQLPLNVIMVLDTSGSVEGERLDFLKKGAAMVVNRLRPADRAALLSFSGRLALDAGLTGDHPALIQAISGLKALGGTALIDAAFAALALGNGDVGRTLVLLFTDGVDTASLLGEQRVVEAARRSDAIVYAVGIRETPPVGPATGVPLVTARHDRFLKNIAEATGGRLLYADEDRALAATFARVIEEFNNRYVLGYVPTGVAASSWHRLTVRLKTRQGRVVARRGYFAGTTRNREEP